MVGVPAFLKCVCGPSARIGCPLPCLSLSELMMVGPKMKTISAEVISARAVAIPEPPSPKSETRLPETDAGGI